MAWYVLLRWDGNVVSNVLCNYSIYYSFTTKETFNLPGKVDCPID